MDAAIGNGLPGIVAECGGACNCTIVMSISMNGGPTFPTCREMRCPRCPNSPKTCVHERLSCSCLSPSVANNAPLRI